MIHADTRREALERWLAPHLGGSFALAPASADASFRRYWRATLGDGASYVAMDAPPDKEDCRPFVRVAAMLREAGVHAPQVLAQDLEQGFLLLSDLGRAGQEALLSRTADLRAEVVVACLPEQSEPLCNASPVVSRNSKIALST